MTRAAVWQMSSKEPNWIPMTVEGETGQESVGDPEERSETECSMKEEGRGKGPRERRGRVGPLLDGVVHCDADANANAGPAQSH